jgi:7,8-dihydropterin-6-yl-methyl-4-(beta-D-ribofuranosyl)aminobenzene 5'-phosphate synthase
MKNVRVTAHPNAFAMKVVDGKQFGSPISTEQMGEYAILMLSKDHVKVSENIYFLGEIPSANDFEKRTQFGQTNINGNFVDDFVIDDSAIVYKSDSGLFIFTGCSHSGICNIVEHSKSVCNDDRIAGIMGGFHIFKVDNKLEKTIEFFLKNNIKSLYPCHCVSFAAKAEIHKHIPIHEVGVGLELNL